MRVSDILLADPFNFYNFSISLNAEERIDIQNQNYIRYYKFKIEQLLRDIDFYKSELETSRSMIDEFRMAGERAER